MRQQINLYQDHFRKQKQRFSATTMFRASAAVIVGAVLLGLINMWQFQRLQGNVDDINRQTTDATQRLQAISETLAARPKDEGLALEVARMEKLIQGRYRVQQVLKSGILSNTEGFSQYFAAFARQRVNGLWLTTFDITGPAERMTLQGRSTQARFVPRYIQKLSNEKILHGTEFKVFNVTRPEKKKGRRASKHLEFTISTDADAMEPDESTDNGIGSQSIARNTQTLQQGMTRP